MDKTYLCIDLKSFYASVECVKRGLDPMTANLVVADESRTDRTICLAVSPSLRKEGVKNRCRLFEIPADKQFIIARPRMRLYMETAADIYEIYLEYIAPEDIHVYSIDEAFLDVTPYLSLYRKTPRELAELLKGAIYRELGLTAACGIGSNMYLAKIALDILAKHSPDGIACLDEELYRRLLWRHRPITDFWMIAAGRARRLARLGITCMEQLAAAPRELILRQFGVCGESLIDKAWGRDATEMADVKSYSPKQRSVSHSQVIGTRCTRERGQLLLGEMIYDLCLELTRTGMNCSAVSVCAGFSLPGGSHDSSGASKTIPPSCARSVIADHARRLYLGCAPAHIDLHRVGVSLSGLKPVCPEPALFEDMSEDRERRLQTAVCGLTDRYGKNAVLPASSYLPEATGRERNGQIGGHRA
ncbi:MAG: DNA repair protein [Abditibacteriota bacterium]|nr:DNA repair protein [Abditibacteriota bacterium]